MAPGRFDNTCANDVGAETGVNDGVGSVGVFDETNGKGDIGVPMEDCDSSTTFENNEGDSATRSAQLLNFRFTWVILAQDFSTIDLDSSNFKHKHP